MLRALIASLVALATVGCGGDSDLESPVAFERWGRSSTIVLAPDEGTLWLTSPDDGRVVEVDAESLEMRGFVELGDAPSQLTLVDDELVVSVQQGAAIAVVDTSSGDVVRIATPCRSTGAVVGWSDERGRGAFAACPRDDRIVDIDLDSRTVVRVIPAPARPDAMVLGGDVLFVVGQRGLLRTLSLSTIDNAGPGEVDVPFEEIALAAATDRSASQVRGLDLVRGRPVAAYQLVDNDNRDVPPEQGSYGSVVDGAPRIEPRIVSDCGSRFAVFDGAAQVFSGPSAVAWAPQTSTLWVVNEYTQNVAVLACDAASEEPEEGDAAWERSATGEDGAFASFVQQHRVGEGARGIAVSADGRRAWIDVGFDYAVSRLELDGDAGSGAVPPVVDAARTLRRDVGQLRFSDEARRGRGLFFDATNTHLTPSGIVTCGTCHPKGADDGLRWFLHTLDIPRKVRRTPPAWAARPGAEPFHWDGEFADVVTLTDETIRNLLGGDGLLVDTDAIAAYLAELPLPPPSPVDGAASSLEVDGAALFSDPDIGCAACHSGPLFTDGRTHSVVPPSVDADAHLDAVDTPTLIGVRSRAPFLHDGHAESLRELFVAHNPDDTHGSTSQLKSEELDALLAYLESL